MNDMPYDDIIRATQDAEDAIADAYRVANEFADECEGMYEGMNETARRLKALVDEFKVKIKFALEPIAKDIEAYNAQQSEMEDMAEASRL